MSDAHGVVDAGKDGRLYELTTGSVVRFAAKDAGRTFFFGNVDIVEDFLILRRRCDRADMGVTGHGVSDLGVLCDLDQTFDELIMD